MCFLKLENSTELANVIPKQEEVEFIPSFCTASDVRAILHAEGDASLGDIVPSLPAGDTSDDDCVFLDEVLPMPMDTSSDGLTKHKNDIISGNIPFTNTVCISTMRHYVC